MRLAGIELLAIASLCHCDESKGLRRFEESQIHMGTQFRIVFYGPDDALATTAFKDAFARIAELDSKLSDYKDDSELSQLSRRAGSGPISVSEDLWNVLSRAQEVSAASQGAFDVTVGPAVRLWRRARRQKELPSPKRLAEALERVGNTKMILDAHSQSVALDREGMLLDLGGIAKGYATQEALQVLESHEISRAMVVGGGEVCVGDAPPGEVGWRIAIQPESAWKGTGNREQGTVGQKTTDSHPAVRDTRDSRPQRNGNDENANETPVADVEYLVLTRRSVSTSGDASQYMDLDGKRYSHIVDPRTGQALTARRQATVTACEGMTADALASAICVLGIESAEELLDRFPGTEARIEEIDGNGAVQVWRSRGWPEKPVTENP